MPAAGAVTTADRGSVSLRRILRRNVFTILNGVLFGVSLVLLAFGLYLDAAFTAVPVATNIAVAVVLEVDAKRKLDRLTLITRPDVTVRRSGHDRRTRPDDLVTGDTVIVERGDQAVVDGTLTAGAIEVDESVLTGESEPVSKRPGDLVRSGCICVSGTAAIEVTAVGDATYASGLAREARRGSDERTPLRRDLDTLILAIGILTVAAADPGRTGSPCGRQRPVLDRVHPGSRRAGRPRPAGARDHGDRHLRAGGGSDQSGRGDRPPDRCRRVDVARRHAVSR